MTTLVAVAAGAAGAALRLVAVGAVQRRLETEWPWGTALVNVFGSFGMGVVVGVELGAMATALLAGALAGFTTFSTWTVEATLLWVEGHGGAHRAVIDLVVPLAAGLGVAAAGLALGGIL